MSTITTITVKNAKSLIKEITQNFEMGLITNIERIKQINEIEQILLAKKLEREAKKAEKLAQTTTTFVEVPAEKPNKANNVTYLAENVTGKALMKSIYKANNDHKTDLGTFSQCLKRAIEFGAVELASVIKNFNVLDMCAKNLIPLRAEGKTVENKWSVYEVLMLTKKYYKTK